MNACNLTFDTFRSAHPLFTKKSVPVWRFQPFYKISSELLKHPVYVITNFRRHAFLVKNFQLLHGFTAVREYRIFLLLLLILDDSQHVRTQHKKIRSGDLSLN
jgi:hypothetical protein